MKNIFLLLSLIVVLSACTPEEDQIDERDKFVGNWQCKEHSSIYGNNRPFSVTISKEANSEDGVKIANFYLFGFEDYANATVSGKNINIPDQLFCDHKIKGEGYIDNSGSTISWEYTVDDGSGKIDSCTAIYTKI